MLIFHEPSTKMIHNDITLFRWVVFFERWCSDMCCICFFEIHVKFCTWQVPLFLTQIMKWHDNVLIVDEAIRLLVYVARFSSPSLTLRCLPPPLAANHGYIFYTDIVLVSFFPLISQKAQTELCLAPMSTWTDENSEVKGSGDLTKQVFGHNSRMCTLITTSV